jgi:hypothetical protein
MGSSGLNASVLMPQSSAMDISLSPTIKKKPSTENKMAQSVMGGRPTPRQSHNVLSQSMDFGGG